MQPRSKVSRFILSLVLAVLFTAGVFLFPSRALCKRDHIVYFPNTAYELNIYKIYGKKPGKTLMLIGGIQGNEPGGFLSADLYADMSLERGNLIVVPRANFYSIILNQRGPNGDMNRKFTHEEISSSMEDRIVTILKRLISESDYLLNLHDGAGYYYPKYINKWRNPMRFGQAIIADCAEYRVPGTGKVIKLREMAERVIREVNPHISNELYKFHFMNTRTGDPDSPHGEQRRSATYYALTRHHIPAFGVETSKFLPSIDLKVRYHNLVINAFKKIFGIIPESPGLKLDPPALKYLVVSINGQTPIVVKKGETIRLHRGDIIDVTHIESNYERGLSLDILGYGGLNDYRKAFGIFRNTSLLVRKDNQKFAEIPIKIVKRDARPRGPESGMPRKVDYFIIESRGKRLLLKNGETLEVVKGDKIKILDVIPRLPISPEVNVNFKGFVGDKKNNTGEDRGYIIDTARDLMRRYSLNKQGNIYEIIVSKGKVVIGRLKVSLIPPRLDFMVLKVNNTSHCLIRPGETVSLKGRDRICLEEIRTNLHDDGDVHLNINGRRLYPGEVEELGRLCPEGDGKPCLVRVTKGSDLLGKAYILPKEGT
ncbi:MAG: hypothetical protein JRF57_09135 [Deltaproteobacteria bacterium]|nr:hypothetical protein [Deltaproteobacteria bacterium]